MVSSDREILHDLKRTSSDAISIPYQPRNIWKCEIRTGNGWVEKDYSGAPLLSRLYGSICLHWEAVALRRLKGIEGVPVYLGRPKRNLIRMTLVRGIPLDKLKKGELSELCFHRLQSLTHQIHSKGVAHGDLHMRNILIHEDKPSLIDFSTAYVLGRLPVLDKQFFRLFVLLDLERLYKTEKEFFGRGTPPKMFYLYRLIKGIK
jgi:hypothetical protein